MFPTAMKAATVQHHQTVERIRDEEKKGKKEVAEIIGPPHAAAWEGALTVLYNHTKELQKLPESQVEATRLVQVIYEYTATLSQADETMPHT